MFPVTVVATDIPLSVIIWLHFEMLLYHRAYRRNYPCDIVFRKNVNVSNQPPVIQGSNYFFVTGLMTTITNNSLASKASSSSLMAYSLWQTPSVGQLHLNGTAINLSTTFYQSDIDQGLLSFNYNCAYFNSSSLQILYHISDLTGGLVGPLSLNYSFSTFFSASLPDKITVSSTQSIFIDKTQLQVMSPCSTVIIFAVKSLPNNAIFFLRNASLSIGATFTQSDINAGLISYTFNSSAQGTVQVFQFSVTDGVSRISSTYSISFM